MGAPPPTGPPLPFASAGGGGGACAKSENPLIIKIAVNAKIFFIFDMVFICFFFFFLPHPPAPSPKREGEARLLGFVVMIKKNLCFKINTLIPRTLTPLHNLGRGRGWGYFIKTPFVVNTSFPAVSLATTNPLKFSSIAESSLKMMVFLISFWPEVL